jgi:hypothetical protein
MAIGLVTVVNIGGPFGHMDLHTRRRHSFKRVDGLKETGLDLGFAPGPWAGGSVIGLVHGNPPHLICRYD